MMIDIHPLQDMILVRREPYIDKVDEGGTIIQLGTSQDKESQNLIVRAVVLEVGAGYLRDGKGTICRGEKNRPIRHGIKKDDFVLLVRFVGHYLEMPCKEHGGIALVKAKDILAQLVVHDETSEEEEPS